jgi:hypothetical protein
MKIIKNVSSILCVLLLFAASSFPQYTIPMRTYTQTTCPVQQVQFNSWDSAGSIASTDPNYVGNNSWSNPGNISNTGLGSAATIGDVTCANAAPPCVLPIIYGSINSPNLPSSAVIQSIQFSFYRTLANSTETGMETYTLDVDICAGFQNTPYTSCNVAHQYRISGQRVPWVDTAFEVESYTFAPDALVLTTANINAGINFSLDLNNLGANVSSFVASAITNQWQLVIYYTNC